MGETDDLKKELNNLLDKIKQAQKDALDTKMSEMTKDMVKIPRVKMSIKRILKGHLGKVNAVDFDAESRQLISAGLDGKLIIWDSWTGNKLQIISPRSSWVMTASISPSGNSVSCGGMDNMCSIYDLNNRDENSTGKLKRELLGFEGFLSCSRFLNDSKIITGSADMKVILWDIETGKKEQEFDGHAGDVMSLSLHSSNGTFITGSVDKTAKLWDSRDGLCRQTFWGHESDINSVYFHRNGNVFSTASEDKTSRLYDIRCDQEIGRYSVPSKNSGLTSCAMSISGRVILCGSEDACVHSWDSLKESYLSKMGGHDAKITSICIADNGMAMASASWDASVRLWLYS